MTNETAKFIDYAQSFASTRTRYATSAGHGTVKISTNDSLDPPTADTYTRFRYPLKLVLPRAQQLEIAPRAKCLAEQSKPDQITQTLADEPVTTTNITTITRLVHTLFILSYGGGVVSQDRINLEITLTRAARLILLTQGNTKIFKRENVHTCTTGMFLQVVLSGCSSLCYIPDPVQPYQGSFYDQHQKFIVLSSQVSLCICDWVTQGRYTLGEKWSFDHYNSRNEIWLSRNNPLDPSACPYSINEAKLLLRDSLILSNAPANHHDSGSLADPSVADRVDYQGISGTLILLGPCFETLSNFFHDEYTHLPRLGIRKWDDGVIQSVPSTDMMTQEELACHDEKVWRSHRIQQEQANHLQWIVSRVRGNITIVKFTASNVQACKSWLLDMIQREGSLFSQFGDRSVFCLR